MHPYRTLLIIALACVLSAPAAPHPAAAALRLNEIMAGPASDWDGSGAFSSRDDEWIEVVNDGAAPIDLTPYLLTDAGGTPRFRFTGTLDPGAHLVVFGSDAYAWERDTGHPAFGLSLGNSGDTVMLWAIGVSDTTLTDSYAYVGHLAAADRAIGRLPDKTDEWKLFDAMNPYTGSLEPQGNGCLPSPGSANACEASTPVESASWGRLKTLYR
jgi:hypothetical protein